MKTKTEPQAQSETPSENKPVAEIRIGVMKAAIWRNVTDKGIRHNVNLRRIYRDGDKWKSTDSFGRDDLLTLAKVADQAHSWICGAEAEVQS